MVEDWLPENYFCKFYELLDENIVWTVYIYRYYSILNSETIELDFEQFKFDRHTMFTDGRLRDKSYISSETNMTSSAYVDVDTDIKSVTVYARNNFIVNKSTFKVVLTEETKAGRAARIIYTVISSLFSVLICLICVAACFRCMGKAPATRSNDYNVGVADPNWDQD